MGRLQTKEAECDYKEYDQKLTEQFIYVLDDFKGGVSIGRH